MHVNKLPGWSMIRFLTGPLAGSLIQIHKPVISIGRDSGNDIVIADPKIAEQHACIRYHDRGWSIENCAPTYLLVVDQHHVQHALLQHNSVVGLGGTTTFLFFLQAEEEISFHTSAVVFPTPQGLLSSPPIPSPWASVGSPEMMTLTASLEVRSNTHSGKQVYRLAEQVINIGSDASNDIVVNEQVVSGFHAQLIYEGKEWILVHPHPNRGRTLNGLYHQGRFIRGDELIRKPLVNGDIFRISDKHGTLVTLTFHDGTGHSQEPLPEIYPIPLGIPFVTIGRLPDNMVTLDHPQISAYHARLEQVSSGYRIIDLKSTNHVYVNGQAVTNRLLKVGDDIHIGPFRFTYINTQLTQYDERGSIRIDALNLRKADHHHESLLNDVSLVILPRKFVALVGSSGVGKSALLDALNGLQPTQLGTVLYNGQDYYRNYAAFSSQVGLLSQDDIVHAGLTIYRVLYYGAKLRLPGDFTGEQIERRIDEVLEDVEMTECRDLLIQKLSAGQRKRASIALELLAEPSVLFLDQLGATLDPGQERKLMFLLRQIADKGCTVILVTDATNNINLCDDVCFLAQGGSVAYFGPPDEAKAFFSKTDFAEIYSFLEPTSDNPNGLLESVARFKASKDYQTYVVEPMKQRYPPLANPLLQGQRQTGVSNLARRSGNPWVQFWLLSLRSFELLKNDVRRLLILLLQVPIIALVIVSMVRYGMGTGLFDASKIVQCRASIETRAGLLVVPNVKQTELVSCDAVEQLLQADPNGAAYAQSRGGVAQALQDFILPGSGGNAQTVLLLMAFISLLAGCLNGTSEIVKERSIYCRERAVNLGIVPYIFSKIIVFGILCLLQTTLLIFIVNLAEPLRQGVFLSALCETYITLALTGLAGLMIGLVISALVSHSDRAIGFGLMLLLPQVIFSGAMIPLKNQLTQAIAAILPLRWAMVALGSSVGLHSDQLGGDQLFGNNDTYHGTLFSIFRHADATNWMLLAWLVLAIMIVFLAILVGIVLKRKDMRA